MTSPLETPHKNLDNTRYAGFDKRLKAFAFDYIIICSYIVLLFTITQALLKITELLGLSFRWPENPILADLMAFVTLVLPIILYFTLQESSPKQATWGKRKAGLRVVNASGGRLTRKQAFVRSFVKFLPWQIAHTSIFQIQALPPGAADQSLFNITGFALVYLLAGVYIASALILKNHRTPYDWASGSCVIDGSG